MGYMLLNEQFENAAILENYASLIWKDRYFSAGDFEIVLGLSTEGVANYKEDYYLWSSESDHVMIVEDIEIEKSEEDATTMTVTGRSLESILDRRVVWTQTNLTGNLQTGIKQLLDENLIVASDTARRIPNFIFQASTDPKVTSLTIDAQFLGENLHDVVSKLCEINDIGFRVTLSDNNVFVFQLYAGADRSYDQVVNPRVIFSPDFDNVGASKYLRSRRGYKNVTLIGGEGEDSTKRFTALNRPGAITNGIKRREMYVESSASSDNGAVNPTDYNNMLLLDGYQALVDNSETSIFDGEIESSDTFLYQRDFFLGDIVQLEDDYVLEANSKSRVVEFIRSESPSGNQAYPTLKSV